MKIRLSHLFLQLALLTLTSLVAAQDPGNPKGYLKGYFKTIKGDSFNYHSPQPNVGTSLLIRSIEENLYIEWETEPVPSGYKGGPARFIMLAAIDVNPENPHNWDILVNGTKCFRISSPRDNNQKKYTWTSTGGLTLDFDISTTDMHGDQHGYMTLTVPEGKYEKGKPLTLKVIGENANSPTWFMVFRYGMEPDLKLVQEQAVTREGGAEYQQVRLEYVYMGDPVKATVKSGDIVTPTTLNFGYNTIRAKLPVVKEARKFPVTISVNGGKKLLASEEFILEPVVKRTIHLLHHSHNDIGYTHVQDEVKQIQWKNLESAIDLAEKSQGFPPEARFKWNSEVMWGIETYLRENEPAKAERLKAAISKGWIGLDAFYSNTLTELCSTEELVRLTADARRIAAECGVKSESAMITDIPGWSWGIVPVLARSGVRYLSLGTNVGHRIGSTIKDWGDRPFYWVSPSGEEKVLCWIHEKAYSLFHTGLKYDELKYRLDEGKIFGYLNELHDKDYPYEIITLRYNIGSDNGPTDPTLSQAVKAWNEKYVTPTISIMTVTESFSEFERRYGDKIPSVTGAFTGYWEDGAASSALETSMNRMAASNINIADALFVMNNTGGYETSKVNDAWRSVLLYDEHTWGSWNSISEPENPFTLSQWAKKRSFAIEAVDQSNALLRQASSSTNSPAQVSAIEVINTHSWDVTDLVTIKPDMNIAGPIVKDKSGAIVPSQKLSTGELVFVAKSVPAMGSSIYTFEDGTLSQSGTPSPGTAIENESFRLSADEVTGSVRSLIYKRRGTELTDNSKLPGLNTYFYVSGRSPVNRFAGTATSAEVIEKGPVVTILKTTVNGKGSKSITNYYELINGIDKVNITTEINKENIYTPEGVHLAFPFNIPAGVIRLDLAYGVYRADADQMKAACKNYLTPEKWVDISNQDYGVTLVTKDAPLVEIGDITADATAYGWISALNPSQTIYSYVMNNYWETNYKASQEGIVRFRYTIIPHGIFISNNAEMAAIQESEPLQVVAAGQGTTGKNPLFRMRNNAIVVTALVPVPDGYLVRLFNASGAPENLELTFRDKPAGLWFSDFDGKMNKEYVNGTLIPAWGIRTIKVRR
ncbi:MAG: glycoside hydrolase family 38 C-terminal domain-containing protein [Bacteroidales bacterium]